MLQLLDFRRRNVKLHGSRNRWMPTIISFSGFYLELRKRFGFDTALSLQAVNKPPIF